MSKNKKETEIWQREKDYMRQSKVIKRKNKNGHEWIMHSDYKTME